MASINNDTLKEDNSDSQPSTVINFPGEVSMKSIRAATKIPITKKHVLVVGPIGSGKTSLIHMLTNNSTIHVGQTYVESTQNVHVIPQVHKNVEYAFIDTPGFGGLTDLEDDSNNALSKLFVYLASKQTRFDCILFVWKKGRIDNTFTQGYTLLKNKLIKRSTPFILIVTGCEMEEDIESTTDSISKELINVKFDRIVCGTTLKGGRFEEQYRDIRKLMRFHLWQNITELCANRTDTIEDALEEASTETETWMLVRWVIVAWELFRGVVSYGKDKLTGAVTWVLVNTDLSTQDVQLPHSAPSNINQETHSTHDQATNKPRLAYQT